MTQVSVNRPERQRQREPEVSGLVPWEQRQLFTQLLEDDGQLAGLGASLAGIKASGDVAMVEALTEHLASRLHGVSQWPLMAVLYVPRLGRINSSIRREQGAWTIDLEAEQEATAHWLRGVRQPCERRLATSLGQSVRLHVANAASA